ncbi:hypothetical protein FQZ97_1157220 [compost metagenome]
MQRTGGPLSRKIRRVSWERVVDRRHRGAIAQDLVVQHRERHSHYVLQRRPVREEIPIRREQRQPTAVVFIRRIEQLAL